MKNRLRILFLFLVFCLPSLSLAQMFGQDPIERERTYDVQHIKIEVRLDLEKKTVDGVVTTSITPLADKLSSFKVDAVGMNIKSVKECLYNQTDDPKKAETYEKLPYDYDGKEITIKPAGGISKGSPFKYQVEYSTSDPEKGLYFIQPTASFPNKKYEVWSQGEGEDNRYWFPCYDYPNDKATTEVYVTVDGKYQTLSNGKLTETKNNPDGTKTWHWVEDKPHSSYLVMVAAGNWDVIHDSYLDIPIDTYVPVGDKDIAIKSFDKTADMMKFFSEKIGYKYAWGDFSQVVVQDFIYGGMENTTAVVLTDVSLYDDRTPPDYTAADLVAHELAHQWWGDVVTCRNWNETYLNESFATYFQCLYKEYSLGKDEFDYNVFRNGNASMLADSVVLRRPIYSPKGLTVNTYDKGSVVMNMLRYTLGDSTFWKAMNIYITDNQFQNVTTENLLNAVNKARTSIGRDNIRMASYKWFFDEWVYSAGQPSYSVSYDYNEDTKEMKLNAQQIQRMDSSSVFKIQVPVRIVTRHGTVYNQVITPDETAQTFTFSLDGWPLYVVFNAGNKILSKVFFSKEKQDWLNQLHYSEDAIDRITAIHGLADSVNDPFVEGALMDVLNKDPFWGVRSEAASVLGRCKESGVIDLFLQAYDREPDPRVRKTILSSIASIKKNTTDFVDVKWLSGWILDKINKEQSYYAIAEGVDALSKIVAKDSVYDFVAGYVNMDSHNDVIRRTVLSDLEESGDKRALDIFMEYAAKGSTSRIKSIAISGLGKFDDDQKVIDFLNSQLAESTRRSQDVILRILEKAKNPTSRPFLQVLMDKTKEEALKDRIKKILEKF